jgi:hypothetical protein
VQPERLIKRNRLPALTDAEFATSFRNIGHSNEYKLSRRRGLVWNGQRALASPAFLASDPNQMPSPSDQSVTCAAPACRSAGPNGARHDGTR